MVKSNIKNISRKVEGIDTKTLEGLVGLLNSKHVSHIYEAIKSIKYVILRDEFSFPEGDPVKNALNKSFYKGGDFYLTLLVNLIKKSPELLDVNEENVSK